MEDVHTASAVADDAIFKENLWNGHGSEDEDDIGAVEEAIELKRCVEMIMP